MAFVNYTLYNKVEDLKRLKFIEANLPKENEKQLSILEVGCGNGNISYQLAMCGHIVTGIDISQKTILFANDNFGSTSGLQFKVINAESFQPNEFEKFDVIVCSEVLEHLYNPEKLTKNFKNMLNPGGIAIVTVPNGFGPRELLITKPSQKLLKGEGVIYKAAIKSKRFLGYSGDSKQTSAEYLDHLQFFTIKELTRLAKISGFKITQKKAGNFIENVFPFSLLTRRSFSLQKFDCFLSDILPLYFTSQFYTLWEQEDNFINPIE